MGQLSVSETKLRLVMVALDKGATSYKAINTSLPFPFKKRHLYDSVKILIIRGFVNKIDHLGDQRGTRIELTTAGMVYLGEFMEKELSKC